MTSASQYASLRLAINFKGRRVMMPQPQLNRPIDPTSRSLSDSAQLLVSLCKLISWLFGKLYSSSIHCNGEDWTNVNHLYLFLPCIVLGYFSKAQNSQTDVCAQIFLIKLQQVEFPDWIYLGYFVFQGCQDSVEGSQRKIEVRNKDDTGCNIHRLSTRAACRRALGQVSTPVDFHQCSVSNHLVLMLFPKHSWKTLFCLRVLSIFPDSSTKLKWGPFLRSYRYFSGFPENFSEFEYFSDFGVFFPIVFFRSFEVYFSKYLKIFPSVQWKHIAKNEGANNECRNAEMMKMLKMATRSSLCAGSRLLTSDLWRVFKCLIRKGLKKPLWMSYEGRLKSHFTCLVSFFKEGARCACHSLLYF